MIALYIYLGGLILFSLFVIYRCFTKEHKGISLGWIITLTILYPIVLLYLIYDRLFQKRYVLYFDKKDSPYKQDYQPNLKYHKAWKRNKCSEFLGHKVIKIKLFGIITVYKVKEAK